MDEPETGELLREIRDLQRAQLDLFREWQGAVSGRQIESIKDAEAWREAHLTWQKRQARSSSIGNVIFVAAIVAYLGYSMSRL
ncbi:MAG: hypothetical protein JWO31_574 [Phycisphaerales bacterium]|nr:hypothetical protein [Phycisphaerales bacterium]